MELTKANIDIGQVGEWEDPNTWQCTMQFFESKEEAEKVKQQLLDDYEKARKLEEVLPAYEQSLILHSNLRKFIEEEFQHYDTTFKKHKDIDDFKVAQVLQKILRRNKK